MAVKTKAKKTSRATIAKVVKNLGDNWLVRNSNDGVSHNGFKWGAIGAWTEAPDWNTRDECAGGLFGQGPGGYGYCKQGTRFEFCETGKERVVVENTKVKVKCARILFVKDDAYLALQIVTKGRFLGSLDLSGCDLKGITLPTSVGGSLGLRGCKNIPDKLPTKNVIR